MLANQVAVMGGKIKVIGGFAVYNLFVRVQFFFVIVFSVGQSGRVASA